MPVNVVVEAFKHYTAGYAEHHFQTGLEGSGIENDFLVTTSGELWLFSYFFNNAISVEDAAAGLGHLRRHHPGGGGEPPPRPRALQGEGQQGPVR